MIAAHLAQRRLHNCLCQKIRLKFVWGIAGCQSGTASAGVQDLGQPLSMGTLGARPGSAGPTTTRCPCRAHFAIVSLVKEVLSWCMLLATSKELMVLPFTLTGQKRQSPYLVRRRKTDGLLDSCRWPCQADAAAASRCQELCCPYCPGSGGCVSGSHQGDRIAGVT